jgi:multidrug efflux pump subunit AcrB
VIDRLRPQLAQVTGPARVPGPVQDLRMGGRSSNSTYQYTLKSDNLQDLRTWSTKLAERLKHASPQLTDVDGDEADNGVETFVKVDRESAARLGVCRRPTSMRAVQRLRPALGGHHLRRAQPVLGDHGVGAALPAFAASC